MTNLTQLVKLTSPVLRSNKNSPATVSRLISALQKSNINLSGINFFTNEEEDIPAAEQKKLLEKFPSIAEEAEGKKNFNVYRREVPILSSRVKGSVPQWAHGASPAFSIGPLESVDGRKFWFDFYFIVELVSVFRQGESQPLALINLSVPVSKKSFSSFTVDKGSAWLRADLLASSAGNQRYVSLKVLNGTIKFSKAYSVSASKTITIDASTTFDLEVDLDNTHTVPPIKKYGKDANKADAQLPSKVSFHYSNTLKTTFLADGSWKLYADIRSFTFAAGENFHFDPPTSRIYLPVKTSAHPFKINNCESEFYSISGSAEPDVAGWSLPVTILDINNPIAASGNGAWMLMCKKGLQCAWQPFSHTDTFVQLAKPTVLAEPGKFSIGDLLPEIVAMETDFNLWLNNTGAEKKIRSTVHLRLKTHLPVIYYCSETGVEGTVSSADTNFQIDRPVQVDESPVRLQSKNSMLWQWMTAPLQYVMLLDADMLSELNPFDKFKQLHTQSYALVNGLLVTTPPAAIFFIGELKNENSFEAGMLTILYGLFSLIPSLPHPYASTHSSFERMNIVQSMNKVKEAAQWVSFIKSKVIAFVQWTEDPVQDKTVSLSSDFRILGNLLSGFAESSGATANNDSTGEVYGVLMNRTAERVALLDVSTQADLFGVAMLWSDRVYRSFKTGVAEQISEGVVNINNLNLQTPLSLLMSFTVPGISWEPMINRFKPAVTQVIPTDPPELQSVDPKLGYVAFENQGLPSLFYNQGQNKVNVDAEIVIKEIIDQFNASNKTRITSFFNLPYGMLAWAYFQKINQHPNDATNIPVGFNLVQPKFTNVSIPYLGALQVKATGAPDKNNYKSFSGLTMQLANLVNLSGVAKKASTLGASVHYIFNKEFYTAAQALPEQQLPYGVPVERLDFSGYGNHMFSDWRDPEAKFAQTSQVKFHVLRGRTAQEVIQVVSILYPWGIKVVRTITVTRENSAIVYRDDSGWRAQSDGLYDFTVKADGADVTPFVIHPGVVKGLFNVTNIQEIDGDVMSGNQLLAAGDLVYDPKNREAHKFPNPSVPANSYDYKFQAVTFNADVLIENALMASGQQYISGKKFKAYVQLAPEGVPVSAQLFSDLLKNQSGSLGGEVDCIVSLGPPDAGGKNQKMKISRVDVNASFQNDLKSKYVFVAAAKGSVILPAEGSWSLVQHDQDSGTISPADNTKGVPLIKKGEWQKSGNSYTIINDDKILRIEHADSLLNSTVAGLTHFGFLQNTGTQKLLLRQPRVNAADVQNLIHEIPDFADSFRLLNSSGPFPNINDVIPVNLPGAGTTKIIEQGFQKAMNNFNIPDQPFYIFNESSFKLYVEYKRTDKTSSSQGNVNLGFDSSAKIWNADLNNVQLVVDLGSFQRLLTVSGCMNAANGIQAGFNPSGNKTQLILCDELQPIYDILMILASLNPLDPDYEQILKKGLEVAMSNSADNWEYKLNAEKEIPLIKFPPEPVYSSPQTPFKIQAGMKVGAYFNMPITLPSSINQLTPSAGAYLQLDGQLEVMCVTVGAASIFAIGTATVILACDIKSGPSLFFKFGFGAEIVVGLPVIANVSVMFVVGVDMSIDAQQYTVGAFMMFKGTADILGGIVTVTIQIEAAGQVQKRTGGQYDGQTNCIASVTFSLDISVMWVIDISFSESWSETRQIA